MNLRSLYSQIVLVSLEQGDLVTAARFFIKFLLAPRYEPVEELVVINTWPISDVQA